jgi:hypothetical protein
MFSFFFIRMSSIGIYICTYHYDSGHNQDMCVGDDFAKKIDVVYIFHNEDDKSKLSL